MKPYWHVINDAGARVLVTENDVPAAVEEWERLGCASRESWQYARDHSEGYQQGRSDARGCTSRELRSRPEAYVKGYRSGYRWASDHPLPVLAAV